MLNKDQIFNNVDIYNLFNNLSNENIWKILKEFAQF